MVAGAMPRAAFLNRVRSLFNIDADELPKLDRDEWRSFRDDPVRFFMRADDWQAAAIWREVEKRQARREGRSAPKMTAGTL